jgi:exodeoxyribonuclease V beta subunit
MKSFCVIDRLQNVQGNHVLEASAGTGKTFSIENIVIRLLLEPAPRTGIPLTLEEILVVTFTRASTRDLKVRIRSNLEKSLSILQGKKTCPPSHYLTDFLESGDLICKQAIRRLEQALFSFNQAPIFTIHGFCMRALRENLFESGSSYPTEGLDAFPKTRLLRVLRDFFRTAFPKELCSPAQLELLVKSYRGKDNSERFDKLLDEVLEKGQKGLEIIPSLFYQSVLEQFLATRDVMGLYDREKIMADFMYQSRFTTEMEDSDALLAQRMASILEKPNWSWEDFEILVEDGVYFADTFVPERRKKREWAKFNPTALHYPLLIEALTTHIKGIVDKARDKTAIFANIVRAAKQFLERHLKEEEALSLDNILMAMREALDSPAFVQKIKLRYKTAIIDEFQDTDPVQWEIFRSIFLDGEHSLYLVGDPKQSIYAFRRADIYTYLAAADALGEENRASLDTNYRSCPSLVEVLNVLFSAASAAGLLQLPKLDRSMPYHPVKAGISQDSARFSDGRGALHFFLAEHQKKGEKLNLSDLQESCFFPFIAEEIASLHRRDKFHFKDFAVLVSDRFQGQKLGDCLKLWHIPYSIQRCTRLGDSPVIPAMRELLKGVLNPRNESALKTALGGPIISWTHHDIKNLENTAIYERTLMRFYALRKRFFDQGFASFFQMLMQSIWKENEFSVAERILHREQGVDFHNDLLQIAELLTEEELRTLMPPESFLSFLDGIEKLDKDEDAKTMRRQDPSRDAVKILTIHTSKGLEFPIVFAIGLMTRKQSKEKLLPVATPEGISLQALGDCDPEIIKKYYAEVDAEKIRQLYVAMTRAKERLYVPAAFGPGCKAPELGEASAMDLFLARLGYGTDTPLDLYHERIAGYDGAPLLRFLAALDPNIAITHSLLPPISPESEPVHAESAITLVPPSAVVVPGHLLMMHSFTSLSRRTGPFEKEEGWHGAMPHNFQAIEKTPHTLPAGNETGVLLHKILELIPFQSVRNIHSAEELLPFVVPHIEKSPYLEWKQVLCEIVYQALQCPLGGKFRLADLDPHLQYRETEFLYPWDADILPDELQAAPGFLKGVIDLVFCWEGRYYLLDWKSNWLGPASEDYRQERLGMAMREHNYFLQASIYIQALKKFLLLTDPRPFDEMFGGVFYVFLRGISPGQNNGVFFIEGGI